MWLEKKDSRASLNSPKNLGVRIDVGYLVHGCSGSVRGDGRREGYIGGQCSGGRRAPQGKDRVSLLEPT